MRKNFKRKDTEFIVQAMMFILFGEKTTKYNYGMCENLRNPNFSLRDAVVWILDEERKVNLLSDEMVKFPNYENLLLDKIPQIQRNLDLKHLSNFEMRGYHRSGWQFVMENLFRYQTGGVLCGGIKLEDRASANSLDDKLSVPLREIVVVDGYIDKTFGWDSEFYAKLGRIPIRTRWIGFMHHTFNEEYSKNSLERVFANPLFIESLKTCIGIFVLSNYLKHQIQERFKRIQREFGITSLTFPPVISTFHPTEIPQSEEQKFNIEKYVQNKDKKLIQIGAWMRDTFAIYRLTVPSHLRKVSLKGKGMGNYYVSKDKIEKIQKLIIQEGADSTSDSHGAEEGTISKDGNVNANKYLVGLAKFIGEQYDGVEIMENINNSDYDSLLTENVVFINLVDASAANTVIECIVRNTPILVNKLPALVEYLGKDYPLFYDTLENATALLINKNIIYAHRYLRNLSKEFLTIERFMTHFTASVNKLIEAE